MYISTTNIGLTAREIQVLNQLMRGHTNKKIAQDLNVQEKTIEFHLQNIYSKIGVKNRVEAAIWVVQNLTN